MCTTQNLSYPYFFWECNQSDNDRMSYICRLVDHVRCFDAKKLVRWVASEYEKIIKDFSIWSSAFGNISCYYNTEMFLVLLYYLQRHRIQFLSFPNCIHFFLNNAEHRSTQVNQFLMFVDNGELLTHRISIADMNAIWKKSCFCWNSPPLCKNLRCCKSSSWTCSRHRICIKW